MILHTKITTREFKNFTYSKKSHLKIFNDNGTDRLLLNKEIDLQNCDIIEYQSLLIASFIFSNIKKESRILQLGERDISLMELLSKEYECWVLKNPEELLIREFQVTDDAIIKYKDSEDREINNKNFDFVFSLSTQSGDAGNHLTFVKNLQNLTKPLGYILNCFVSVILDEFADIKSHKITWYNNLYKLLSNTGLNGKNVYLHGFESKDPNLFYLSKEVYNNVWKDSTKMEYHDFGKPFSNNLLWQNREYLSDKNYQQFSYSKKSNIEFFFRNNFVYELMGKDKNPDDLSLKDYQCLLIYAFAKSNITTGSKILQIGEAPELLKKILNSLYQVHEISDCISLANSFDMSFRNKVTILDQNNNAIDAEAGGYDFVFSLSLDQIPNDKKNYDAILKYLKKIKRPFAYNLFCFENTFFESDMTVNGFLFYLFKKVCPFNYFVPYTTVSDDDDLWLNISNPVSLNSLENFDNIPSFSYNVIWQDRILLPLNTKTKSVERLKSYPAYIFHHIIKCGGTSVREALENWFKIIDDNIGSTDINLFNEKKYDLNKFDGSTCLTAHFQFEGIYLHERYPEAIERNKEFKIFTFIRDPLDFNLSIYYYAKHRGELGEDMSLRTFLKYRLNEISKLFPCDESNYKKVIDRYMFVGIVERMQESFDMLASLIGRRNIEIPFYNTTKKDSQVSSLTSDDMMHFRKNNKLDYLIYDYCLKKLRIQ